MEYKFSDEANRSIISGAAESLRPEEADLLATIAANLSACRFTPEELRKIDESYRTYTEKLLEKRKN